MMIRTAVAACLAACVVAPAAALEVCRTEVERGVQNRMVQGYVDGDRLHSVLVEDDDIRGVLTLDPAASGYTASGGGAVSLTPYRTGQSVDGKDWQAPGSVATTFGGMALHWPRFYKDGKRIARTTIVFDASGLREGAEIGNLSTRPDAETLFVIWDKAWFGIYPRGYMTHDVHKADAQDAWISAPASGNLRVEFYDGKTPLGVATFAWPEFSAWSARMVGQVNALRKVQSDGMCTAAMDLNGGDEEF